MSERDAEIDRLYQLPLDEFTAARNALAKSAGKSAVDIRALRKPPVAAWAINQIYWQQRDLYESLMEAAGAMRATHAAILSGKKGDLRGAGKTHEAALEAALKAALGVLAGAGHPVTDATKHAIATTLRALPADEPPGRLTHTLQPGGFEMLAGIQVGRRSPGNVPPASAPVREDRGRTAEREPRPPKRTAAQSRAIARAREALAAATRAVRAAEHTARREEFQAARAAREAEKAARALDDAREAVEAAQRVLAEAERDAVAAGREREAAAGRAERADKALAAAREKSEAAQEVLNALL